jgi:hypothetical protein
VIVLGGDAVLRERSLRRVAANTSLSNLVPLSPPTTAISLQTLLAEMKSSIDDFELISNKLLNPEWVSLFRKVPPDQFGGIISCVHDEFDQPRVGMLLAPHLNDGRGLTCAFAAAAIRNASSQHRAVMAQRLLPLCVDARSNHALVRAELDEWEQTVASGVLEDAMR